MKKTILIPIAHQTYGNIEGGCARFLSEVIPRLTPFYHVKFIGPGPGKKLKSYSPAPGIEVFEFPSLTLQRSSTHYTLFGWRAFKPVLKCDLVFAQTIASAFPLVLAIALRKPMVTYLHELPWLTFTRSMGFNGWQPLAASLLQRFSKTFYRQCQHIFLPSSHFLPLLTSLRVQTPVSLAPLGIDKDQFIPTEDRIRAKVQQGFSAEDIVVGYVGRLSRDKNFEFLMNIFRELQKKFSSLKLLVVGKGAEELEKRIRSLPGTRLIGWQKDVLPFYHAMDIFCMPSPFETTSLATMEAMAAGIPSIAMRAGRVQEYIQDGVNSLLVEPGDEHHFAESMERLITDATLRKTMAHKARERMAHSFSWDETVTAFRKVFDEILGQ